MGHPEVKTVQINGQQYYLKPVEQQKKQSDNEDKLLLATFLSSPTAVGIYRAVKKNPEKAKESAQMAVMINPVYGILNYFLGKEKNDVK